MTEKVAIIAGVTGIAGLNLATHLTASNWKVFGCSRRFSEGLPDAVKYISLDFLDADRCCQVLLNLDPKPTHVFFTASAKGETEQESVRLNVMMMQNFLRPLLYLKTVKHVALLTGARYYMGTFVDQAAGFVPDSPFREDGKRRLSKMNYFYVMEDVLMTVAKKYVSR
eukprot:TRINITY_DN25587_c0_g1_i1.p1 TRINITY_DN25587_c0_g1~~TRINITY_DN25587_c0_g1_i1.p1  ORF type:complete len:188 (-),score=33.95 TRINITY_DN25587_c0_g1_i1:218-721(-)